MEEVVREEEDVTRPQRAGAVVVHSRHVAEEGGDRAVGRGGHLGRGLGEG